MARAHVAREQLAAVLDHQRAEHRTLRQRQPLPRLFVNRMVLAEEAREPEESVPNAYKLVALAVFAIYFTLPLVALSALPVKLIDGELTTLLALPPEQGGYANDPILGVVNNLGLEGGLLDMLELYVGVLAAHTLLVFLIHGQPLGRSTLY